MQSRPALVVIVGTGGTIAGTSAQPERHVGYQAGVLGVDQLVAAVPALQGQALEAQTLARLDSCDMDHATWQALREAVARQLARPEVAGVVVTHGTDTLEETAYFLHRTLAAPKPVVLTAAMRPASAPSADGPQNLLDAVALARYPGARGVVAMLGGQVLGAVDLRKLHGYRVEAFSAGDAGPLALMEDGVLRSFRPWPAAPLHAADPSAGPVSAWPVVEIVTSHAGARAATLDALVAAGAAGLVIAGTGNGSVHHTLLAAAARAQGAGVRVVRASRCLQGGVVGTPAGALPSYGPLTPAQARVELMLDLLAAAPPA
ncbi:L-asparaginase [Rubrivivax sp. A210]|uniref:asparaginase n=1 Tax=Rubrivivax sp. A210 TaxID=2772301 RepID=UPI00191A7463|nr:asparaginase [Rubrivivax sp. A210]CAD5369727.1 L-asparaginase [Rubrivivax sp. A210]